MESHLFEQILGIADIKVKKVTVHTDKYEIEVESSLKKSLCIRCGRKCEKVHQYYQRRVRDLPISGKQVYLILEVRQFECEHCNRHFAEPFSFVLANKTMTVRFEDYLYYRSKGVDLSYICRKENVDWKTINSIFIRYSKSEIEARKDYNEVKRIAIDEIALKKGHRNYVVILLDLDKGVILDVLKQRDKAFLINYFRSKGAAFCDRIKVFSSDMWEAYLNCAKEVFQNATIVADRFHFFSKCQDGMNVCRRYFRRQNKKDDRLNGIRWALMKNPQNLSKEQFEQLKKVFKIRKYKLLKQTYEAKNEFRNILEQKISSQKASVLIEQWIDKVKRNRIRFLFRFVQFYYRWKEFILNYFDGRFSTGKLEGVNNKLKMIKRRAFGYLDFDAFRARALVEFY